MIIYYKKFLRQKDNLFFDTAITVQGCCDKIVSFCLTNRVDYNFDDNVLVVRPVTNSGDPQSNIQNTVLMYYCHYCGARHDSVCLQPETDESKQKQKPVASAIKKTRQ